MKTNILHFCNEPIINHLQTMCGGHRLLVQAGQKLRPDRKAQPSSLFMLYDCTDHDQLAVQRMPTKLRTSQNL